MSDPSYFSNIKMPSMPTPDIYGAVATRSKNFGESFAASKDNPLTTNAIYLIIGCFIVLCFYEALLIFQTSFDDITLFTYVSCAIVCCLLISVLAVMMMSK